MEWFFRAVSVLVESIASPWLAIEVSEEFIDAFHTYMIQENAFTW
jgi:hypothetical protein